jgi:NAD(P)H dehydrogenase (quinone)
MSQILVLYYSSYGHVELMARAQAEGVARVAGAHATVKRVPELTPTDLAKAAGFRLDQSAPIAQPDELEHYDAIIFGTPTRFGNMASQMRNFLDPTARAASRVSTRNYECRRIWSLRCVAFRESMSPRSPFVS